ncbi:hypothetical protein [Brumimicrobium mesophilum]|uniref:hypothetical protein n=1 Tax=Brumimicrobium mesophilum TaxID=392717 RepID=UPI000D1448E9|nr:hypothetical protein [Brumimicrobium mesophilum]
MNLILKYSAILGASVILASCSNYGYISENDVYMQAPTEINLEENEDDITSFNAFKARNKGAFEQEYKDPRVNQRVRANQIMIINAYHPYGTPYGRHGNGPLGFHGMGWNNSYYASYNGFNSGLGPRMNFGGNYFYYDQMNPFGYGYGYGFGNPGLYHAYGYGYGYNPYGYNPYYGHGYYGNSYYGSGYYGNGYYGNGYYGNNNVSNNPGTNNPPSYYGQRSSLSSNSSRSSYNPSKSMMTGGSSSGYNVNNETLGDSRRGVKKSNAGGSDYNTSGMVNKGGVTSSSGAATNRTVTSTPTRNRMINNHYTPTSSARRTGAVQSHRQAGSTSVQSNRTVTTTRSSGTFNSSLNTRTTSPSIQTSSPRQRAVSSPSGSSSRGSSSSSSSSRRR